MIRFYQADLRDLWRRDERGRPVLSLRRLHVLIRHLPGDSATHFYLFGPMARWGPTEYLLADLWEAVVNRGRKKGAARDKYPRPKRQDRPVSKLEKAQRAERRRAKYARQRSRYGES